MILGIAARSSMAIPIGPFKKLGDISVTKMAMPMATGTAIARESTVVTTVPNMVVAAPKDSFTGFQSVDFKKLITPKRLMASDDSSIRTIKMPMTNMTTSDEANAVIRENAKSTGFFLSIIGKLLAPFEKLNFEC